VTRHEVYSINTHSAERRSIKTDKSERFTRHWSTITGLQTLFATALEAEPHGYGLILNTNVN